MTVVISCNFIDQMLRRQWQFLGYFLCSGSKFGIYVDFILKQYSILKTLSWKSLRYGLKSRKCWWRIFGHIQKWLTEISMSICNNGWNIGLLNYSVIKIIVFFDCVIFYLNYAIFSNSVQKEKLVIFAETEIYSTCEFIQHRQKNFSIFFKNQ